MSSQSVLAVYRDSPQQMKHPSGGRGISLLLLLFLDCLLSSLFIRLPALAQRAQPSGRISADLVATF
jgi:hypothetical protein